MLVGLFVGRLKCVFFEACWRIGLAAYEPKYAP